MKKITYICDKCFREVATRLVCIQEQEETHLMRIGSQEWCVPCMGSLGYETAGWPHKAKAVEANDYKELKGFYL